MSSGLHNDIYSYSNLEWSTLKLHKIFKGQIFGTEHKIHWQSVGARLVLCQWEASFISSCHNAQQNDASLPQWYHQIQNKVSTTKIWFDIQTIKKLIRIILVW